MTRRLAVLRPEPGNAATLGRARAAGFDAFALPLFAVVPVAWTPPDPAGYDALILTSANALRFGGAALDELRALPVLAVGAHTAAAARAAGFTVAVTGTRDAASLVAQASAHGIVRALHLSGEDRTLDPGGPVADIVPVYGSAPLDLSAGELARLRGTTALLHSTRAARRLAQCLAAAAIARSDIALAAFAPAIAVAAGEGWAELAVAAAPDDAALLAAIGAMPDAAGR